MNAPGKTAPLFALGITLALTLAFSDLFASGMPDGVQSGILLTGLRLPRMLTALCAGAALALSGALMQAVFRNPLADPHILGISSGAGLGAAVATMALSGSGTVLAGDFTIAGAAAAGAAFTSLLLVALSRKTSSAGTMLIFGVLLSFILGAIISIISYSSGEEGLKIYYSWNLGTFSASGWKETWLLAAALTAGFAVSYPLHGKLDMMLFGDEFTRAGGVSPGHIRSTAILSCCIMAGAVTSFCGPVGFIGIVGPHVARAALRTSVHKAVLPASALCGGCLALCADILSQLMPAPVPAGSSAALIGIPIIMAILLKNK